MSAVIPAVLFVMLGVTSFCHAGPSPEEASEPEGAAYIRYMEEVDPSEVRQEIYNTSSAKLRADLLEQAQEDPDIIWKLLKEIDTVIMGDSRVLGFTLYEYMYESRIIADGGATIHDIPIAYETLDMIQPGLLVLAYGINDINHPDLWEDADAYIEELNILMEELTQRLPDTYIYVQSIIPAGEEGLETSPTWAVIPEWNARIRENCEEHGWRYLDVTSIVTDHGDLYDSDGVHFQEPVYRYWGEEILNRYIKDSDWLEQ